MLNEKGINRNYIFNVYYISKGKINYNQAENIIKYKNNLKFIIKHLNKERLNESE